MRKVFIIFTFMVTAVTISCSQSSSQTNETKAPATIEFKITEYDFGTIEQGANGTCEFEFKNTGEEPLVLNDVKSSCGCTIPSWPKEPVKKGDSAKIIVKYDTNRIGPFTKSITVISNATNSPIVLRIKGTVNAPKEQTGTTE